VGTLRVPDEECLQRIIQARRGSGDRSYYNTLLHHVQKYTSRYLPVGIFVDHSELCCSVAQVVRLLACLGLGKGEEDGTH
jgi:hypothetical protein